jgi:predicted CoA-binding protein
MKHLSPTDEIICTIIRECNRVAVMGISDKSWRASHRVARHLQLYGYEIHPVNPVIDQVLGLRCYPNLWSVLQPVDVVDIFRRQEFIPGIVEGAIEIGARAVWMQSGLVDEASAERARRAGLLVVMDRCMMVEHLNHSG